MSAVCDAILLSLPYTGDPVHRFYQMWQQADCGFPGLTAIVTGGSPALTSERGEINRAVCNALGNMARLLLSCSLTLFPCYLSFYLPAHSLFQFQAGSHLLQSLPPDGCD